MVYITELTKFQLQTSYKKQTGSYPTWLGDAFGWSGSHSIYNLAEQMCHFIDEIVPDWFPFGTMQSLLTTIIKAAYKVLAHYFYWDWAYRGDQLVKEFDKLIGDYKAKIEKAVADAKAYIENNFIAPLKSKIDYINGEINGAQTKLDDLNRLIEQAKKTLTDHDIRLKQLESRVGLPQALGNLFNIG